MDLSAGIFVAGHNGLVGSALVRRLELLGASNIIRRTKSELDLADQRAVEQFFASVRPQYVLLAAAKVGGIHANSTYPAEFIQDNLAIQTNVIHSAWKHGVKKLLFLGSSCIYPRSCEQPIREDYLLSGPLEPTNEYYAIAKIAGLKMCQAYRAQYGFDAICLMPTNLYGPGDNYHPENSHVLPALIRRFHEAKRQNQSAVTIWGTGTPRREFLFVDDFAEAAVHLMDQYSDQGIVNVGVGTDIAISDLARVVATAVGFEGEIRLDASKPDGTPRKLLDTSLIRKTGWSPRTSLEKGIQETYSAFLRADHQRQS